MGRTYIVVIYPSAIGFLLIPSDEVRDDFSSSVRHDVIPKQETVDVIVICDSVHDRPDANWSNDLLAQINADPTSTRSFAQNRPFRKVDTGLLRGIEVLVLIEPLDHRL